MIKDMPKLEIVPAEKIVFHELYDPERVNRLAARIRQDRHLRNPIIATRISRGKYMVLDGVTRANALKKLDCNYVLAQIVDYFDKGIQLNTWYHLIVHYKKAELLNKIKSLENVQITPSTKEKADSSLNKKKIVAYLLLKDRTVYAISNRSGDLLAHVRTLRELVDIYSHNGEIYRVKYGEIDHLLDNYEDAAGVLVVQNFSKRDIINISLSNEMLPAGVTRHIIPKRAIGLNISLSFLEGDGTLEERNKLLREHILEKVKGKKIRFYPEPTFYFDE
ncbi:ParB N-terminal domain-containing protein [Candidatus Woesearchaeota archaeon]|nr:ParB N-terminal domain-containing protein [Candidatus Woesearchaeota archaeon]